MVTASPELSGRRGGLRNKLRQNAVKRINDQSVFLEEKAPHVVTVDGDAIQ
jgi:hypothetical protein